MTADASANSDSPTMSIAATPAGEPDMKAHWDDIRPDRPPWTDAPPASTNVRSQRG